MKKIFLGTMVLPLVLMASTANAAEAKAELLDTSGNEIGTVHFTDAQGGVLIALDAKNLSPGVHAVHLHERGRCNPEDGFESAGSHFAPDDSSHGFLFGDGAHAGDLPNQFVSDVGELKVSLLNGNVTLSGENALIDADGAALVIHSGADDYRSQPSGSAGERVACGVITRD